MNFAWSSVLWALYLAGFCGSSAVRATGAQLSPSDKRCSALAYPSCSHGAWRNTESFTSDTTWLSWWSTSDSSHWLKPSNLIHAKRWESTVNPGHDLWLWCWHIWWREEQWIGDNKCKETILLEWGLLWVTKLFFWVLSATICSGSSSKSLIN